ncbi:MAG TPA: GlsB/YeaQ/YmgE family stress response membrane protein [Myxococcota bacterium]|nr:GlsB/YeaQ/YmgE family stress response membrane protein [Myxococcota bacterium]
MPGPDGGGILLTSLLGIAGALIGGFLAGALGLGSYAGPSFGGFVVAVLGAMLLLGGRRMLRRAS